jgi:hypothetical protein
LEEGTYIVPLAESAEERRQEITAQELSALLSGDSGGESAAIHAEEMDSTDALLKTAIWKSRPITPSAVLAARQWPQ